MLKRRKFEVPLKKERLAIQNRSRRLPSYGCHSSGSRMLNMCNEI